MKPGKLSLKTKLGYGVGDIGGNLYITIKGFFLNHFLTDVISLSAFSAGIATVSIVIEIPSL